MSSSENEFNVGSKNQFFGNNEIPYCLKAGMVAVLVHGTIDYYKKEGKDTFMALFCDKDNAKDGKAQRVVSGTMSFTFGVPESMGEDNCMASIKKFTELYPSVGDVLDNLASGNLPKSDEEICQILATASAHRFNHSAEGSVKNWEEYVSENYDVFVKQAQSHYPGLISVDVYEDLKDIFSSACKKKQITQAQM